MTRTNNIYFTQELDQYNDEMANLKRLFTQFQRNKNQLNFKKQRIDDFTHYLFEVISESDKLKIILQAKTYIHSNLEVTYADGLKALTESINGISEVVKAITQQDPSINKSQALIEFNEKTDNLTKKMDIVNTKFGTSLGVKLLACLGMIGGLVAIFIGISSGNVLPAVAGALALGLGIKLYSPVGPERQADILQAKTNKFTQSASTLFSNRIPTNLSKANESSELESISYPKLSPQLT